MMKQTIYLVDSENVNDAWVPLLPKLGRRDQVIVFHTKNSPHFTTESASLMADFQNNLTWEKCFTGTNGLDFQLVSRLGYLICKKPRATFVIVSNDTGFDAAIKYWVQEGKQVSRIRGASCSEEAPLTEVQEKIVLEDAPDKQLKRPRKRKKKSNNSNQAGNGRAAEASRDPKANQGGKQLENQSGKSANQNGKQSENQSGKPANQNGKQSANQSGKPANQNGKQPENQNGKQPENQNGKQPENPKANQGGKQVANQGGKPENQNGKQPENQPEAGKPSEQPGGQEQEKSIPVSSVLGICRSISMNRHELIHESLVALLGAEDGREVYHFLKDNQEFQVQLKKIYLQDRNDRVENYLKVVFEYHKEELPDTEQIRSIINKYTAGDRNGIFQAMTEAFGHKRGARYYGILKAHVRVLKKM